MNIVRRRVFLQRGLMGGAMLALAAGGVALFPGDRSVTPPRALMALSQQGYAVLVAVAGRVLAQTSASPKEIAMRVDFSLRFAAPQAAKDLGAALMLLENALTSALLRANPTPFTLLNEAAQDRALLAWRDSRLVLLRGAYHALRKLCLAAHYASPQAWPEVAYPGPSIAKAEPPAIDARAPLWVNTLAETAVDNLLPAGSKG